MKNTRTYLILICYTTLSLIVTCIAQTSGEAVDYYGNTVNYEIYSELSFNSNTEAVAVVSNIMSLTGLKQNFQIKAANVDNAFATIVNNERAILYSPAFMREAINDGGGSNWVAISILAHEIAHHLNNHFLQLEALNPSNRKTLELEADEFAGFVMYKMGANLEQTQLAIQSLPDIDIPSKTHPTKAARLVAVGRGWYDAQTQTETLEISPTLTLNSKPSGVNVYLDERYLGTTPLDSVEIAAGEHSLRLSKDGYNDEVETFLVEEGQKLSYRYTLSTSSIPTPITTGTLSVSSIPSGVLVYINDQYIDYTPFEYDLEEGNYSINLSKEGYEEVNTPLNIIAGQNIEKTFTLTVKDVDRSPPQGDPDPSGLYKGSWSLSLEGKTLPITFQVSGSGRDYIGVFTDAEGELPVTCSLSNQIMACSGENTTAEAPFSIDATGTVTDRSYSGKVLAKLFPGTALAIPLRGTFQLIKEVEPSEDIVIPETQIGLDWSTSIKSNADWTPQEKDFDGVTMMKVPAGKFRMGSDNENDEKPVITQNINIFWIDETEVTREAYESCVATGVCISAPSNEYSNTANQPINRLTWYQATTYCNWRGSRLPTEAEWEYAARGPDSLIYPWGNEFDETKLHYAQNSDNKTAPVGSYPTGKSWVGALDMIGNVWEWTSSLYKDYPYSSNDGREIDENEKDVRELIVLRGDSFWVTPNSQRAADRNGGSANFFLNSYGFRCARSQ